MVHHTPLSDPASAASTRFKAPYNFIFLLPRRRPFPSPISLFQEYVVEDLSGQEISPDWTPPPLPPEHERQLKDLGLL